jgi:hypothetical protein
MENHKLSSSLEILPAHSRAEIEKYAQYRIAELLAARDEFVFEPFFRLRRIANEMFRIQTVPERRKWQVFYERFGCLHCQTTELAHTGNGLCSDCYKWVSANLKKIVREGGGGAR